MAIIEDYAAIADEQQRIRAERQLERTGKAVPIGVLRVPTPDFFRVQKAQDRPCRAAVYS